MKKILKFISFISTLLIVDACSWVNTKPLVDQQFVNALTLDYAQKLDKFCQKYDGNDLGQSIYYHRDFLETNIFLGLKDHNFEILSFRDFKDPTLKYMNNIYEQEGIYTKEANKFIFKVENQKRKTDGRSDIFNIHDATLINIRNNEYLITNLDAVAHSLSWSNQLGILPVHFKKISCTYNELNDLTNIEDMSTLSFQDLPSILKEKVLERPLHLKINHVEDITQQIKEHDDPETPIVQNVKLNTNDISKLFKDQSICFFQQSGARWDGVIIEPNVPYTIAEVYLYQLDEGVEYIAMKEGDMATTSEMECEDEKIKLFEN